MDSEEASHLDESPDNEVGLIMENKIIFGPNLLKRFIDLIPEEERYYGHEMVLHIVSCYFSPDTINILPEKLIDKTVVYFDVKGLQSPIPPESTYSYFGIEEHDQLFHPKIYYFDGKNPILLLCSSNFTLASLKNLEAGYIFRGKEAKRLWDGFSSELKKLSKISGRDKLNSMAQEKLNVESTNLWIHQDQAVAIFLEKKYGILEMATGTGKTRTAIKILNALVSEEKIDGAIITSFGTDLLDQWHKEILLGMTSSNIAVYRQYEKYKELSTFIVHPEQSVLLISKDFLPELVDRKDTQMISKKLLICDEVHHMGANQTRLELDGKLTFFPYRLGLSATPEREYDESGNKFVEKQIGPVIFRFGLKDAIERGILCEFDYVALKYELNDEDKNRMKEAYARYHSAVKTNPNIGKEKLFIELARVKKLSLAKIPIFEKYLSEHPEVLERTIIFVETMEYGHAIQDVVINYQKNYHTYYGEDDRENLTLFANNKLQCLITCKRISEGIDIHSVNNVILFSTSRAKLETIQRIGRCLRKDPKNPSKRAKVIDFVIASELEEPYEESNEDYEPSDLYRYTWLSELSHVRRKENG